MTIAPSFAATDRIREFLGNRKKERKNKRKKCGDMLFAQRERKKGMTHPVGKTSVLSLIRLRNRPNQGIIAITWF